MKQLKLIVSNEYATDLKSKSFWVATFVFPLIAVAFGVFIGFMSEDSKVLATTAAPTAPSDDADLTGLEVAGMLCGMLLTLFLMINGAQIFNKVKAEKSNRIVEIMATMVPGRTMLLAKVVSVGLLGFTQVALWIALCGSIGIAVCFWLGVDIPIGDIFSNKALGVLLWGIVYFLGGYVFYGAMFAACGAISGKNNENQEYMTIITFVLLGSFYIGQFAVDHGSSQLAMWCSLIPFTSPTVGCIRAVAGTQPWWQSVISILLLYSAALATIAFAGKMYTSALLLRGKKLSPRDLVAFMKAR